MTTVKEIISAIEEFAPNQYQESYDNVGLLIGDYSQNITGVLLSIDCTEKVVEEAIEKKCQLIISHHPLIFKGLKRILGASDQERAIRKAIKHDIAIFASHTNLDKVKGGVNFKIAEKIGLKHVRVLSPEHSILNKLTVFVPKDNLEAFSKALFESGAGNIGNYSECGFISIGLGTFTPNENSNPTIGKKGEKQTVEEAKLEVIFPSYLERKVLKSMFTHHPYEEVAYYLERLENKYLEVGLGAIGELPEPIAEDDFITHIKSVFGIPFLRHTAKTGKDIQKVALCGGSGSSLIPSAISQTADCFITADTKYHDFFLAENKLLYIDIGHFESEQYTTEIFSDVLSKSFPNIAVILTEIVTNPVNYA